MRQQPQQPAKLHAFAPMTFAGGEFVLQDRRVRRTAMDFALRVQPWLEEIPQTLLHDVFEQRPTLSEHACTHDYVSGAITLPHLLEHITIDLLVQRDREVGGCQEFAGYTRWLDRKTGLARITLKSIDHAQTHAAMIDACKLMESLILQQN